MRRLVPTLLLASALGLCAAFRPAPTTPPGWGQHSLHGPYGFTYDGTALGLGPVASSGRIDFDGFGHVAASFTTSVGGVPFTGTFTGTYQVEPDGTGSVRVDLPWLGTSATGDFVVVDHGGGAYFTSTDRGYSVAGRTTRM